MEEKERKLIFKGTKAELRSLVKDLLDKAIKQATQTCLEDEIKWLEKVSLNKILDRSDLTVIEETLGIEIRNRLQELKAKVGK